MVDTVIRRAVDSDAAFIERLLIYMSDFHHKARPDLFMGKKPKFNQKRLIELMHDDRFIIFVAEGLGYLIAELQNEPQTAITMPWRTLYIHDLCVSEDCRKGGIGSRLMDAAKDFAHKNGCGRMVLNVYIFDGCAEEFYKKYGFDVMSQKMSYNF